LDAAVVGRGSIGHSAGGGLAGGDRRRLAAHLGGHRSVQRGRAGFCLHHRSPARAIATHLTTRPRTGPGFRSYLFFGPIPHSLCPAPGNEALPASTLPHCASLPSRARPATTEESHVVIDSVFARGRSRPPRP